MNRFCTFGCLGLFLIKRPFSSPWFLAQVRLFASFRFYFYGYSANDIMILIRAQLPATLFFYLFFFFSLFCSLFAHLHLFPCQFRPIGRGIADVVRSQKDERKKEKNEGNPGRNPPSLLLAITYMQNMHAVAWLPKRAAEPVSGPMGRPCLGSGRALEVRVDHSHHFCTAKDGNGWPRISYLERLSRDRSSPTPREKKKLVARVVIV